MFRAITIISDFGTADGYPGAMKGVIRSIAPGAVIDDISAEIAPGDISAASIAIENYHLRYPEGTVHLAVVDPGVGSPRKGICLECRKRYYVGPDNGIFEAALGSGNEYSCYRLDNPEYRLENVSATFHGRDIFAPAAAYLSLGVQPSDFGPRLDNPVRLAANELCVISADGHTLSGRVIHADRFGNLLTNISRETLKDFAGSNREITLFISDVKIEGISEYYSQAPAGDFVALIGSGDRLEISVNGGNALRKIRENIGNLTVTICL